MFNELTSNAHYVALLAAAGVIAAGWRQFKAVMQYLSSFFVITVKLESRFTYPLNKYLRSEWDYIANGNYWIVGNRERHQTKNVQVLVPYKLPASPIIYRKGCQFIILKDTANNRLSITTFRWTSIEKLVIAACELDVANDIILNTNESYRTRYQVYDIVGRDKSDNRSLGSSSTRASESPSSGGSPDGPAGDQAPWIFADIDQSFMYSREEYTEPPTKIGDGSEFLPKDAHDLIQETLLWFEKREWFQNRMIPWRRGILLHGPGGTGKSTFAMIMARKLMIPIYRFHLNTLSDKEFLDNIQTLAAPCVVLFEDFDRVFKGRDSVKNEHLSFDTVINSMSGVRTLEGVIFVITTNNVDAIDAAIGVQAEGSNISSRPGRIDRILYMGALPEAQRHAMIDKILGDWPDLLEAAKHETTGYSIVQTQEYCVQKALQRIH